MSASVIRGQKAAMTSQVVQPLTILVVDDDDINQRLMNILLSEQGHAVKTASNGQEALALVMSDKFDLVFMDLQLPDMNGPEVCKRIREWEAGRTHLPIVALTADDIPGHALEWLKAGMDDYIFKPYNPGQLSRMISLYAYGQDAEVSNVNDSSDNEVETDAIVLDTVLALLNFSGNVDAYKGFLKDFVASLPERVELMGQHQESGCLDDLARNAHNLKGVSASLGAMQLSQLASRLECHCRDGQNLLVEAVMKQIRDSLPHLQSEAIAFLGS